MKSSVSIRRAVEPASRTRRFPPWGGSCASQPLGNEEPAQALIETRLRELGFDVRSVEPDAAALAERPESGIPLLPYEGRRCLVGTLAGGSGPLAPPERSRRCRERRAARAMDAPPLGRRGRGRPAVRAWRLRHEGGHRGDAPRRRGRPAARPDLPGPLVYQSVIEEECGGNGALAACLEGRSPTAS